MSASRDLHPGDLRRYPFVKAWSKVPAYRDAPFASRAIVDAALRVFMDRGRLPVDERVLRQTIGAKDWEGYTQAYPAARLALDALLPRWQVELETSLATLKGERATAVDREDDRSPGEIVLRIKVVMPERSR